MGMSFLHDGGTTLSQAQGLLHSVEPHQCRPRSLFNEMISSRFPDKKLPIYSAHLQQTLHSHTQM